MLDYVSTHSTTKLKYQASDMCIHVDTYATYLVAPKCRSRIVGYFYLGKYHNDRPNCDTKLDVVIHVEFKLLKNIVSWVAEAEKSGIYTNCQAAIPLRHMLKF